MTVAALYIDPHGPYPRLLGPELCWDAARDARNYDGPWPVVAHPPCGGWGKLAHLYQGADQELALLAVQQVRRFGGVLEHPAYSRLWAAACLPAPGDSSSVDPHGYSIEVEQVSWGHACRKRTWLYLVGVPRDLVKATLRRGGKPTHWASGGRTPSSRKGTPVPEGIKVASAQQRRRTPEPFARWLIELAAASRPRESRPLQTFRE